MNHHALFIRIRRVDRTLLWLNLAILLGGTIIPFPTIVLADALRGGDPTDLRVAAMLYTALAALQSAAWIPVFPYLRDHPDLVEPDSSPALFHAQRARPWVGVGLDVAAALVAMMSPAVALTLWTFSLLFLAATSEGVESIPRPWRRRSPKPKKERAV